MVEVNLRWREVAKMMGGLGCLKRDRGLLHCSNLLVLNTGEKKSIEVFDTKSERGVQRVNVVDRITNSSIREKCRMGSR